MVTMTSCEFVKRMPQYCTAARALVLHGFGFVSYATCHRARDYSTGSTGLAGLESSFPSTSTHFLSVAIRHPLRTWSYKVDLLETSRGIETPRSSSPHAQLLPKRIRVSNNFIAYEFNSRNDRFCRSSTGFLIAKLT
jgi:hypothetical protein